MLQVACQRSAALALHFKVRAVCLEKRDERTECRGRYDGFGGFGSYSGIACDANSSGCLSDKESAQKRCALQM